MTYNLANVVDDFDMKITHVIRAEEHLSNTPRQIFMLEGLGYPRPEYAHVPFVAEPGSKNKLSKRKIAQYLKNPDFKKVYDHAKAIADRIGMPTTPETFNPVLVDFYKQVGYLPAAMLNYLVLLGWATEDNREEFSVAEMIRAFSLERVNKAAASLDVKKLFAFQGAVHAGAADRRESRDGAAIPDAGRAHYRCGHDATPRNACRGSRRPAPDCCRRHPRIRLPVPVGRAHRLRPGCSRKAFECAIQGQ